MYRNSPDSTVLVHPGNCTIEKTVLGTDLVLKSLENQGQDITRNMDLLPSRPNTGTREGSDVSSTRFLA
jgi:hypothetical protein